MSLVDSKAEENIHAQLDASFKTVAQKVAMLLASEGIHRKAYAENLPHFGLLSVVQKEDVIQQLSFYADLCQEQMSEGYSLKDSPVFTWRALQKLGLVPPSELFSQITNEDIVEVYSAENRQLFRNFNFFEVCSYSLEELHSIEWWNLFQHDGAITQVIYENIQKIFKGEMKSSFAPDIEHHHVREACSQDRLLMRYDIRLMSPLFSQRQPAAFMVLERATLVNAETAATLSAQPF